MSSDAASSMGAKYTSLGAAHCGERWNTVTCPARSAIAGTICIALAPVPTTATRLPVTSRSAGQRAEWNSGPRNASRPGSAGIFGRLSWPTAVITASAVSVSPAAVVTVQRWSR